MKEGITGSIAETIGKTPLVSLRAVAGAGTASILAKVEYFNPGGSIKDRICLAMIEDAEKRGALGSGGVIIEPTSGNTGIGLAMLAASRRYRCVLTMPETMSQERISILRAYGAEVILTPGSGGMAGAVAHAEQLHRDTPGSFMPQQFRNPANPEAHRQTTAPEIIAQTGGRIDAFVAGVGTGGTITGVGEVLKAYNPGVQIVAVEPRRSPVLSGGKAGPHKIQGIGAGFVPEVLNRAILDRIVQVDDDEAYRMSRILAREEGLFVGISSGAAAWAALGVAKALGPGRQVVVILPDTGERYCSMEKCFNAQ